MMMTMMPLDENEDEEETNKKNRNAIDMAVYLVEKKMVKSVVMVVVLRTVDA